MADETLKEREQRLRHEQNEANQEAQDEAAAYTATRVGAERQAPINKIPKKFKK